MSAFGRSGLPSIMVRPYVARVELTITRWKRYGKDRSYVGPAGGPSLGYIDNDTGQSMWARRDTTWQP